jgi:radical SAM-linked protein
MSQSKHFRYRITFAKTAAMRFTSHLDLHRAWERTLRRAQTPLVFSQGFNPRPRLNLSPALPLGCTGECELADIWLERELDPATLVKDFQRVAPDGLQIFSVEMVDNRQPSLQTQVIAVEYMVNIDPAPPIEELSSSVQSVINAKTLPRNRRGKDYDLRPLIESMEIECFEEGNFQLKMRLAARAGATGRPDEVLLSLGVDPSQAQSHRRRLFLTEIK